MLDEFSDLSWSQLSTNILCQDWPTPGNKVYYVGVQKQSDTGLFFNDRLLILQTRTFTVFYTKYMHSMAQLGHLMAKGIKAVKERVNVLSSAAEVSGQNLVLRWGYGRSWNFRFGKEQLALQWVRLFTEVQEQSFTHSIKSKHTASTSDYASILNSSSQKLIENQHSSHKKSQLLDELRRSNSGH